MTDLTFKGTSLYRADGTWRFEITEGLDGIYDVRGVDVVVPGMNGRIAKNRVPDKLTIVAEGYLEGKGVDLDGRRRHYRALVSDFQQVFAPLTLGDLIVTVPEGATGFVNRTSSVRVVSVQEGNLHLNFFRRFAIEFESITYPFWA